MVNKIWFEDFCKKFLRVGDCLIWQLSTNKGYGQVNYQGSILTTHIVMYEQFIGPVPVGKELHHSCEHKNCGEVSHLIPKTRKEHMEEHGMFIHTLSKALLTHCKKGHILPEIRNGRRICKECANNRSREWATKNSERRRISKRDSARRIKASYRTEEDFS